MSTTTWVVVAVVVAILAVAALLIGRRVAYTRSLREQGWTFDPRPELALVLDHHVPPFGLGFDRKPDELVSGRTASGREFRVFEYAYTGAGPRFDERLASLRLPHALPELFVAAGPPRNGVQLPSVDVTPELTVHALEPTYARAALGGGTVTAIQALALRQPGRGIDLAVDGDHLVAVDAPKDADELGPYLEALDAVAGGLTAATPGYAIAPRPPAFDFYGRPDWVYVGRDDSRIEAWGLTRVGHGHRTEDVLGGSDRGLVLDAFVHRWATTRTETSTDSEGRTQTRTVTEHHDETVLGFWLPHPLPLLAVGRGFGWEGTKVGSESTDFDEAYPLRTDDPRFASDVIHPRQMEFLLHARPPAFRIEGRQLRFRVDEHDTLQIGRCADLAHGFLARIPGFVWKNLGVDPPVLPG